MQSLDKENYTELSKKFNVKVHPTSYKIYMSKIHIKTAKLKYFSSPLHV